MDRRRMVSSSSSVVKVGPWGSRDKGAPWDDGGGYTGIRSIIIRHGLWGIGSITVEYDLCGQPVPAQRRGGIQDIKDFETEVRTYHISQGFEFICLWMQHAPTYYTGSY